MRLPLFRVVALIALGVALATTVGLSGPRVSAGRERERVVRAVRGGALRLDTGDALHHDADVPERTQATISCGESVRASFSSVKAPPGGAVMPAVRAAAPPGEVGTLARRITGPFRPTPALLAPPGRAPPSPTIL